MANDQLLPFISNTSLYEHVAEVIVAVQEASAEAEERLYSRVIDPFGAIFDALSQDMSLSQWKEKEKARQVGKTLENKVGDFHQNIIGSMGGWQNLGTGSVVDVASQSKKIIAEIKNKYNTMKGNAKKAIYDDLKGLISSGKYRDYIGYYVEIVPRTKKGYDKPFTPPDNVTHTRRPTNERIRIIDGKQFYALASGYEDALEELYKVLPKVIGDLLSKSFYKVKNEPLFTELFNKAYWR